MSPLEAGKRDRMVTLQSPGAVTHNSSGGATATFSTFKQVWARMVPVRVDQEFIADGNRSVRVVDWEINYLAGVLATFRLVHKSKTYKIIGITEIGRQDGLRLSTVEVV